MFISSILILLLAQFSGSKMIDRHWVVGCRVLPNQCSITCHPEMTNLKCGPLVPFVNKLFLPRSRIKILDVQALSQCLPHLELLMNMGPSPPDRIRCARLVNVISSLRMDGQCPTGTRQSGKRCFCKLPYQAPSSCPGK